MVTTPSLSDLLEVRHARVRDGLTADRLDALVVTHLPNMRYLSGFAGSTAIVVLDRHELVLITDGRYLTEVQETIAGICPAFRLVKVDPAYDATLLRVLKQGGYERVGFEGAHLPFNRYQTLSAALADGPQGAPSRLIPTERLVEAVRLRKDEIERAALRHAGRLLDDAAAAILAALKPGRRERDIAADIDWRLKMGGFERTAFDTIVASGPNSALPHARPGERVLQAGDLVVLDFGGVYDGYCVDLTRTACVGEPSSEVRRLYQAVRDAHAAALAAVRPGATASTVDTAARQALVAHGLGEAFGHATGHGLGLEVHEEPRVGPARADVPGVPPAARDEPLVDGIVITVEPGAYVPGLGGVRLEDDVLVTGDGAQLLTHVPLELLVVAHDER